MSFTVTDFLVWLVGGGCIIAASWVLGLFPGYVALVEKVKNFVLFGVSAVIGSGALAITQFVPADTLAKIAPYFLIVALAFTAVFINKAYTTLKAVGQTLSALKDKVEKLSK